MRSGSPGHGTRKAAAGSGKIWCTEKGARGEQLAEEPCKAALSETMGIGTHFRDPQYMDNMDNMF